MISLFLAVPIRKVGLVLGQSIIQYGPVILGMEPPSLVGAGNDSPGSLVSFQNGIAGCPCNLLSESFDASPVLMILVGETSQHFA